MMMMLIIKIHKYISNHFPNWSVAEFKDNSFTWAKGTKQFKMKSQKSLGLGEISGGPVVNSPSSAGDMGSVPGQGTKIPHATR